MDPGVGIFLVAAAAAAFVVSASAGLGGSLILVPTLSLALGAKEGIALAALLLAVNNLPKLWVYWSHVPWRAAAGVIVLTVVGAYLGAWVLVHTPERAVAFAVIGAIVLSLAFERVGSKRVLAGSAPLLAFGAGATSGFSGTSGPLKGIALRNLSLDRFHLVGAASAVSLAGDVAKTSVYAEASLLDAGSFVVAGVLIPVMILSTLAGKRINRGLGERGYAVLFWGVMVGYSARLLAA
jgi:uncharacterized membrane protein YfcA